jgi:hypothetical protein
VDLSREISRHPDHTHQEIGAALVWPGGVYKYRAVWQFVFRHNKGI